MGWAHTIVWKYPCLKIKWVKTYEFSLQSIAKKEKVILILQVVEQMI